MRITPATEPAFAVGDPVRVARDQRDRFKPNASVHLRAGRTGTVTRVFHDNRRRIWRYLVRIGVNDWYLDEADLERADG